MDVKKLCISNRGYEVEVSTIDGDKYVYLFQLGNPDEEEKCLWTGPISEWLIIRQLFNHAFWTLNGQANVGAKAFPAHEVEMLK